MSTPVYADLSARANVADSIFLGIPADRPDLLSRVAVIGLGKPADENTAAAAQDGNSSEAGSAPSSKAKLDVTASPGPSQSSIERQRSIAAVRPPDLAQGAEGEGEESGFSEATMATALAAVEIAGVLVEGGLEQLKSLTSGGKEHIMDPRIVNCFKIQRGCVPSMNLYATASGLATVAGNICESLREKELARKVPSAVQAACETLGFRPLSFAGGDLTGKAAAVGGGADDDSETIGGFASTATTAAAAKAEPTAFCMCALGGTMVICVPKLCLSFAITVNQLSAQRSAAIDIAKFVCKQLGLGEPVDL